MTFRVFILSAFCIGLCAPAEEPVKPLKGADAEELKEEEATQRRMARDAEKKKELAGKLEAELNLNAAEREKLDAAKARTRVADARYQSVLEQKKKIDAEIATAQNEADYCAKKIVNLKGQLRDLNNPPSNITSPAGTKVVYDFSAEKKVINGKIADEEKDKAAALALVAAGKKSLQAFNTEFNAAVNAKRLADNAVAAARPGAAVRKAKPRTVVSLIDGRELIAVNLVHNNDEISFTTADGKQFKFRQAEINNIRNEGEDPPE